MFEPADFELTIRPSVSLGSRRRYGVVALGFIAALAALAYVGMGQLTAAGSAVVLFLLVAPVVAVLLKALWSAVVALWR